MTERTLAEARTAFKAELPVGTTCPCCERTAKLYRRNLSRSMVAFLVRIAAARIDAGDAGGYVHYSKVEIFGRDYPSLLVWGLAETQGGGGWRPTRLGYQFLSGAVTMHKYMTSWNGNEEVDRTSVRISARTALSEATELDQLIARPSFIGFVEQEFVRRQTSLGL